MPQIKLIKENVIIIIVFLFSMLAFITPYNSTPIMVDKAIIIDPLMDISSPTEYFNQLVSGKLYDVQPIRDLSHLVDIWLSEFTKNEQIPLIQNILILALTCFFLFKILNVFFDKNISTFLTLIFLSHPATFNIYVEFTARKHILSFFFFLVSFHYFNKEAKREKGLLFKSYFFFAISILSHPINSFAFIIFSLLLKLKYQNTSKQILKKSFPYFLVFLSLVSINLYYYNVIHITKSNVPNVQYAFDLSLLIYGMALHFKSYFFPVYFSRFYEFFDLSTFITIIVTPIVFLAGYKKDKVLTTISAALSFSIFFALYGHKSNILNVLYQTYYGLTTSLACTILLGVFIKKSFSTHYYLLFIPLIFISNFYGSIRNDRYTYFYSSSKIEKECRMTQTVLTIAIQKKDLQKIKELSPNYIRQRCRILGEDLSNRHVYINSILIYTSDEFTYEQKQDMFSSKFPNFEDKAFLLGGLEYEKNGKTELFYNTISKLSEATFHSVFLQRSFLGNELIEACKGDKHPACDAFRGYLKKFLEKDVYMNWNRNLKK
jgi:hypothetical protein